MMDNFFAGLERCQESADLAAADYSDLGKRVVDNIRANLFRFEEAKRASALFGKWEKVPAIICGAGPSLKKNGRELHKLKDKALLFAGGSACAALAELGVQPHFSAGIDPAPPLALCLDQPLFEVPFFYQNRVSEQLLRLAHGPLLWASSNGGYPIEEWLSERLGIEEKVFDGGWNVATFSMALACEMGCDPIILVGMDLSTSKEFLELPGLAPEKLTSVGEGLYARRDWIIAKEWIEAFAAFWKEKRFYNATEGGVGFDGIPTHPLSAIEAEHLNAMHDLQGRLHSDLQAIAPIKIEEASIKDALKLFEESCRMCNAHCEELLKLFQEHHPQVPFGMGKFVLHEVELQEQPAFKHLLEPLWNVWKPAFDIDAAGESGFYLNKLLFFKQTIREFYE